MFDYDYIIAGSGAAGLSMVHALLRVPALRQKRILLVDRAPKAANDRTWCFWEEGAGPFEPIVYHRWSSLWVYQGERFGRCLPIAPFTYKMIQAADFYRYMDEQIAAVPTLEQRYGEITAVTDHTDHASVTLNDQPITAEYVFSSIARPVIDKSAVHYLDQHFRGWFIRTEVPVFHPDEAVLMDFRTPQHDETRFLYVLPTSSTEALVEVAIFSNNHLAEAEYDTILAKYLQQHWPQIGTYTIERTEQGNIPMTDHDFCRKDGRVIHLGMSGGDTRASSGYTFYNIQRRVAALTDRLAAGEPIEPATGTLPARHTFYDSVLLRVLAERHYAGDRLFQQLFATGAARPLLRFLNGESVFVEELQVMWRAPWWPFTRAALAILGQPFGK